MFFVVARRAGVQVPAQIIETYRRIRHQTLHFADVLALQKVEADNDIRNLDAGIVDVILHFDPALLVPQHAYESVPEHGISQVPNMRCLVRVDVRVLNDDFVASSGSRRASFGAVRERRQRENASVEPHVDIAVSGNLDGAQRRDFGKTLGQILPQSDGAAYAIGAPVETRSESRTRRMSSVWVVPARLWP